MNIVTEINAWQAIRKELKNKSIGFVPTMGHLHAGHLSLCERSMQENKITVASIFINPTQFNQANDFVHYPRTFERDAELLQEAGVDYLFMPKSPAIYPDEYAVQITEVEDSHVLEGEHRPGHFTGMLTVVLKLFNLVQPTRAYFGEKDYQQLLLIKKMAEALFLPIEIVGCETVRAEDGLALSSRNSRFTLEQRQKAPQFAFSLQSSEDAAVVSQRLQALGFKVDYIAERWGRRLGAVWLDDIRLIDNIALDTKAGD